MLPKVSSSDRLLKCFSISGTRCFTTEQHTAFDGDEIGNALTGLASAQQCASSCGKNSKCVAYSYKYNKCYLYSKVTYKNKQHSKSIGGEPTACPGKYEKKLGLKLGRSIKTSKLHFVFNNVRHTRYSRTLIPKRYQWDILGPPPSRALRHFLLAFQFFVRHPSRYVTGAIARVQYYQCSIFSFYICCN